MTGKGRMVFHEREAVTHTIAPEPAKVEKKALPPAEEEEAKHVHSKETDADRGQGRD